MQYAQATYYMVLPHLTVLHPYRLAHYMVLDAVTTQSRAGAYYTYNDRQGSVLGVLDATTTAMGARLLRRWLEQPLLQLEAINARLDAVAELAGDMMRRQQLRQALRHIYDIERLLGRVACGANARHLPALTRWALQRLACAAGGLPGSAAGWTP